MTIKEIEERTGLSRSNVRFYEAQGLLAPHRKENGYRDYTGENLEALLRIKLLRGVGVSLEDIKALQEGESTLGDLLERHLADLAAQEGKIQGAKAICQAMRGEGAEYATLDAPRYLTQLEREAAAALAQDTIQRPYIPWRRFFARDLDWTLCTWIVTAAFLVFGIDLGKQGIGGIVVSIAGGMVLLYLLEPRILARWGTTPGKKIWGLRVTGLGGQKLPWETALARAKGVVTRGMGCQVPVYNLVCWWRSYKALLQGKELVWEEDTLVAVKDRKVWRPVAFLLVLVVLQVGLLGVSYAVQAPWHRGEITAEEFCANYSRAARLLQIRNGWTLQPDGSWEQAPTKYNVLYPIEEDPPEMTFDQAAGKLTAVSFPVRTGVVGILYDIPRIQLAMKAFVQAQREYTIWEEKAYRDFQEQAALYLEERAFPDAPPVGQVFGGVKVSFQSDGAGGWVFQMEKVG